MNYKCSKVCLVTLEAGSSPTVKEGYITKLKHRFSLGTKVSQAVRVSGSRSRDIIVQYCHPLLKLG